MKTILQAWMSQKKVRLSDVAGAIGCHPTDVQHWRAGRRAVPAKWREKLSDLLQIESGRLFDERGLVRDAEGDEATK